LLRRHQVFFADRLGRRLDLFDGGEGLAVGRQVLVADAPVPGGFDRGQGVLDRDVAEFLVIKLLLPGQQVVGAGVSGCEFPDEGPLPALPDGEVAPLG
jgi:hypothetical protein